MNIMINIVEGCKSCNGFCCRYFILPVKVTEKIEEDFKLWLSYRGCKLIFHKGKHIVKIPLECKHLDKEKGKCKIFNTEQRPNLCNVAGCPKEDKEYIKKIIGE